MNPFVKYTFPAAVLALAPVSAAPPPAQPSPVDPPPAMTGAMQPQALSDAQVLDRLESETKRAKMLGELATERATSDGVKKLGNAVLTQASTSKVKIERTAKSVGVALNDTLPAPAPATTTMEHLRALSGIAFDKAVVNELHASRAALVDLLADSSSHAASSDVKSLASALLPDAEHQRDEAQRLMRELASRPS